MNIAIFTDYYLPTIGGVQSAIFEQKIALEARGHSVTIVTVDYPEYRADPTVICLPTLFHIRYGDHNHRGFLPFPGGERWLVAQLQERSIDVVHIQSDFTVAALGLRIARRLSLPSVYTAHTMLWTQADMGGHLSTAISATFARIGGLVYMPSSSFRLRRNDNESYAHYQFRRLVCQYAQSATVAITPSRHLHDSLMEWGVTTPIVVQPNFFARDTRRVALPSVPTFLWCARLSREKRPLDFVRACEIVARTRTDFRAVIVGDGEYMHDVKTRTRGMPWFEVRGRVAHDKIGALYDQASALVVTSQGFDNQPMTIVEACCHGRGVILVDRNLTDGLSRGAGVWAADVSAQALAAVMLRNIEHRDTLEVMSDAAWHNRHTFLADTGVMTLIGAYEKAMEQHET